MGGIGKWLQHKWNLFKSRENTVYPVTIGPSTSIRPDAPRLRIGTERSIVNSIYNRISVDVSAITFQHVKVDQNGRYSSVVNDSLNQCLTVSANIDQTGRNLIQDIVISMLDEGAVAVVPVDTDEDPDIGSYQIESLRVGKIIQWFPQHVQVRLYNDQNGVNEDVLVLKKTTAIIENPFYSIMNENNSTLKRLIHKLNLLDSIDEQSGSGKMDLIIQLPYVIKTEQQRKEAEIRRKDIEMQLEGSKYGIVYIDGTEHVTQLNRAVDNNLMSQIEYLTSMLYSQLGVSDEVFNGTASEEVMLNYHNGTIEPIASAITNEMTRKFLTKTARTQGHAVGYFKDPFRLVPASKIADIADKFTRNEILSSNDIRAIIGYKPSDDPRADELRNKNLNQSSDAEPPVSVKEEVEVKEEK